MKYLLLILITYTYIYTVYSRRYLTSKQWNNINKIIRHPSSTCEMKRKIHQILFVYYNDWSWSHAYYFKKKHPYKCFHISLNELSVYASIGLLKSIENFKGTSKFTQYAKFYIYSEFYTAITELHPITPISKQIRRQRKYNNNNNNTERMIQPYVSTNTQPILLNNNEWLLNKHLLERYEEMEVQKQNEYRRNEIWEKINQMDPTIKTILQYKITYDFEKKRSNNEISEMLSISEENVRQKINSVRTIL